MKPILYSYYRSSCSYRVRIVLEFFEIDYETRPIHLVKDGGEQLKKPYLDLNPLGQVPFYQDRKVALSQSMAIIEYLADTNETDTKPVRGKSFAETAKVRQVCEIINAGIQPLQNLSVLKRLVKNYGFSEEQKMAWGKDTITRGFESLEPLLKDSKDFCFDKFSLADALLIPQVFNANRFEVDMNNFPKIAAIHQHCLGLDYFKKAHPESQPDFPN